MQYLSLEAKDKKHQAVELDQIVQCQAAVR